MTGSPLPGLFGASGGQSPSRAKGFLPRAPWPILAHSAGTRRILSVTVWGGLPAALTVFAALRSRGGQLHFAGDFHYAFWPAAQRVLHGLSPYVDPGSSTIAHAIAFVYPALAALLLAPLALVPHGAADVIFAGLEIAAVLGTLRLLRVRDWRLYGLVMLCPAVFSGWTLANVTLLLGLGIAAVWRYRAHPLFVGLLIALLVSVKLFLWPLALWLLATRRYAALAYAAACGVILNALAWAALGFHELHRYTRLLHALTTIEQRRGYSLIALALHLGSSQRAAYALALALAAAGGVTCLALGRRGRELAALALAIGVSLLATPIVQLHYFALLLVPLALVRPRLSLAWALPLLVWVCAAETPRPWQIAASLALGAAMLAIAIRRDSGGPIVLREPGQTQARTPLRSLDLRPVQPSASSVATGDVGN